MNKLCGSGKSRKVLRELRRQIVTGRHLPGQRLPSYTEMGREFGVGRAIVQRAIETLKQDGFVYSVDRQGLYVVQSPPHLHQYGIVFSALPGESGWTRLTGVLTQEAHRIEENDPFVRFRFYFGLRNPETQREVVIRLRQDILTHRLAGLIFAPRTSDLLNEPELADLNLSAASLWSMDAGDPRATRIDTDVPALLRRALAHLKHAGRQRIAILHMADTTSRLKHAEFFAEAGLDCHTPWIQRIGRSHPQFAADTVSLLMDYRHDVRPDGIIIADDTLVEPVLAGLKACGVRLGQDIDVVAHANWPCESMHNSAVTRIGFDMRDVLKRAINAIGMRTRREIPPELEVVPALFEWEVDGVQDVPKEISK